MIIFDLDGTLADCEHRRHLVDPSKRDDCYYLETATLSQSEGWYYKYEFLMCEPARPKNFVPSWQQFYEACDKDIVIEQTKQVMRRIDLAFDEGSEARRIEIWSGRSESVRKKTERWLSDNQIYYEQLKMRPIGDNTPDDELKEKWLDELYEDTKWGRKHPVEFVFDDRPKVIRMWRRRGIFVFNCCQHDTEF